MAAAARSRGSRSTRWVGSSSVPSRSRSRSRRRRACRWFLIRKEPKGRGTNRWVEGARLVDGMRVMLVDDVITTGGSILVACERVRDEGAEVVVRDHTGRPRRQRDAFFAEVGVPYVALLTYADLAIAPLGAARSPRTGAARGELAAQDVASGLPRDTEESLERTC